MLSSFKKFDPEGHQKNFWEPRVDLQTRKIVNKRSVAPISTVQGSTSVQLKRALTTEILLTNSMATAKCVCSTQLKIQLWFRYIKRTWTHSENVTLSGSGLHWKFGVFICFCKYDLYHWCWSQYFWLLGWFCLVLSFLSFCMLSGCGPVFFRNGIYELFISIQL